MQDSSKSVVDILSATRNLLSDPGHWTKNAFARDAYGVRLHNGYDDEATCWCAAGAAEHFVGPGDAGWRLANRVIEIMRDALPSEWRRSLGRFNDDPSTTHADILAVLDRAIELAKAEEAT